LDRFMTVSPLASAGVSPTRAVWARFPL
jgi:hypothetical protein